MSLSGTTVMKTYALFDLIGIEAALNGGTAPKLLRDFWIITENWTNHVAKNLGRVTLEDTATVTPIPRVVTYSDSAVLWHEPEAIRPPLEMNASAVRCVSGCSSPGRGRQKTQALTLVS
jgi:hypothetical protein